MAINKLPCDLPENWKINDAVTPNGNEAGLDEKHGFNYLMRQVNQSQSTINELIDSDTASNTAIGKIQARIESVDNAKVDKVSGKGLSANDYTTAEKNKLAGLSNYDDTQLQSRINELDAGKAPLKHSHTMKDISGLSLDWSAIENKTAAYPPDNHDHDSRYVPYGDTSSAGQFDKTTTLPTDTTSRLNYNGIFYGSKVMGAWYNDYAEVREADAEYEAGIVVSAVNGIMTLSNQRLMPLCRVVSDTYGMCIGECNELKHSVSVAVCGRVLVKLDVEPKQEYEGFPVCSGKNGMASIMSREEIKEFPDRMIGVIHSIPNTDVWGNDRVNVNGRVWIEVK